MRSRHLGAAAIVAAALALLPAAAATAHPERTTSFAFPATGSVPTYRSRGPSNVVCKSNSARLLKQEFADDARLLKRRLATLSRCRFHDIQAAID